MKQALALQDGQDLCFGVVEVGFALQASGLDLEDVVHDGGLVDVVQRAQIHLLALHHRQNLPVQLAVFAHTSVIGSSIHVGSDQVSDVVHPLQTFWRRLNHDVLDGGGFHVVEQLQSGCSLDWRKRRFVPRVKLKLLFVEAV